MQKNSSQEGRKSLLSILGLSALAIFFAFLATMMVFVMPLGMLIVLVRYIDLISIDLARDLILGTYALAVVPFSLLAVYIASELIAEPDRDRSI